MEIENNIGQTEGRLALVSDQYLVSKKTQEKIQAALEEIQGIDPSEDQLVTVIWAYKKARSDLQSIVEEPGVSDQQTTEIIERLDRQIALADTILTGISEARRKLAILDNNSPVPEPKLKQLANHLIEALKAAEKLGRTEPKFEKYREELVGHSTLFDRLPNEPYSLTPDESTDGTDPDSSQSVPTKQIKGESSEDSSPHSGKHGKMKYDTKAGVSDQEISKDALIAELHRLKETVGDIPEKKHIQRLSQYRLETFEAVFGSIEESINAAFSTTGTAEEIYPDLTDDAEKQTESTTKQTDNNVKDAEPTRSNLLEEFERVGNQLEKRPTTSEFDELSRYESDDVYEHFDSWSAIVEASEIESATRDDLIDDLHRLKSEFGAPPLSSHIKERGQFSVYDYRMEFGSVEDALEEAGIDIKSQVLEILGELIEESDEKPKMADFSTVSPYQSNNIYKWFDGWDEALEASREKQDTTVETDAVTTEHGAPVQDVAQNELSEIYELVRNLRTVTNAIVEARDEFVAGADESADPMAEWAETVDEFWRGNNTDEPGYGAQQNDRNPFSMAEYRQAFGNGDRVTEFGCTSSRRLNSTVAALVEPHLDADPETFYLPVASDTSTPIPVIVESRDALRRASKMLHRLPIHPEAAAPPTKPETVDSDEEDDTDTVSGELLGVNGVTEHIEQALRGAGYRTREDLKDATMDELATVDEISEQLAMRIKLDVGE